MAKKKAKKTVGKLLEGETRVGKARVFTQKKSKGETQAPPTARQEEEAVKKEQVEEEQPRKGKKTNR